MAMFRSQDSMLEAKIQLTGGSTVYSCHRIMSVPSANVVMLQQLPHGSDLTGGGILSVWI
jgi:hypothetical protein